MSGSWQPIETAPKDGTSILIATVEPWGNMFVAQWETRKSHDDADFSYWYIDNGRGDLTLVRGGEVTHWMPRPAQPERGK